MSNMKPFLMALLPGLTLVFLFSQGQPGVNVDLGLIMDSFLPGDQVSMPITLVTRNDPQIAKIFLEIGYPSRLISFVEATLGRGAEAAGAEVKTELVETAESAEIGRASWRGRVEILVVAGSFKKKTCVLRFSTCT